MGEFDFISQYLAPLSGPQGLGLLDDIALWSMPQGNPPHGYDAMFSVDTLVEGVHFPTGQFDADLARKALRVNISDITAKGGTVQGYLLSLTLPSSIDNLALADFCDGLAQDQKRFGFSLWGGDTTRTNGPAVISITIIGVCKSGEAVLRSTANTGDLLCVSGTIGDAYLGLGLTIDDHPLHRELQQMPAQHHTHWRQCYDVPQPPYEHCDLIRRFASAALDVSDGLLADADHLAKASDVGLHIHLADIPLSSASKQWVSKQREHEPARLALARGGDDYQTLFCVAPDRLDALRTAAKKQDFNFTVIGKATALEPSTQNRVQCVGPDGNTIAYDRAGYTHF